MRLVAPSKEARYWTPDPDNTILNGQSNTLYYDVLVTGVIGDVFNLWSSDTRVSFDDSTLTCYQDGNNNFLVTVTLNLTSDFSNVNASLVCYGLDDFSEAIGGLTYTPATDLLTGSFRNRYENDSWGRYWYLFLADSNGGWSGPVYTSASQLYGVAQDCPLQFQPTNNTLHEIMTRVFTFEDQHQGFVRLSKATTTLTYVDTTVRWTQVGQVFQYVAARYNTNTQWFLQVYMAATTGTAYMRLWDITANAAVANSTISHSTSSYTYLESSAVTFVDGHYYIVESGTTLIDTGRCVGGNIIGRLYA